MFDPALTALDEEFTRSETMTPAEFSAKRAAILSRAAAPPAPPAPADKYVTQAVFAAALANIAAGVTELVATPMRKRMDALEARNNELLSRIAELESRGPGLKYLGTWEQARQYGEGDFATHQGSVWHANKTTRARPGESADWVLAVKRGGDGRDARR